MGIKGIYGEIGPGKRIALSKLAIDKFEETNRPLRIAIDISIWQFQIQAGKGGTNPAIRTFYYRLLRLLSVSVQPLFVFDGPHKPPFKRNKRTGHHGASIPNLMCKQLLKLFGFPFHTAPGEAEAECALLQREGIVDAVFSEDVDTLMFGCGLTLRNWSSEGTKGTKVPTHVSMYDSKVTKEGKWGLDREGMVLIALMSGGDYITEGIPGAGIKVACEAARAGFGKSLCQLSKSDVAGMDAWRDNLSHELRTNESGFFRCKHKSLTIPATFPNPEVLAYYTHPVVSSSSKVQKLMVDICWEGEIDVVGLRLFVAEAFDWTHRIGAAKFIRGLAPVLLVHKLRVRANRRDSDYGDTVLTAMNEMHLVRAICGKRTHYTTDGMTELRVVYHPNDIVGLDLEEEYDDSEDYGRDGLAPVCDDDETYASDIAAESSGNPQRQNPSTFDPNVLEKLWIPETIARVGIPLKVEDFEESLRNPKKPVKIKTVAKRTTSKVPKTTRSAKVVSDDMLKGALDKFVKTSKPLANSKSTHIHLNLITFNKKDNQPNVPPVFLAPRLESLCFPPSKSTEPIKIVAGARKSTRIQESKTLKSDSGPVDKDTFWSSKANPSIDSQIVVGSLSPDTGSKLAITNHFGESGEDRNSPRPKRQSPKFIPPLAFRPAPVATVPTMPRKCVETPQSGDDYGLLDSPCSGQELSLTPPSSEKTSPSEIPKLTESPDSSVIELDREFSASPPVERKLKFLSKSAETNVVSLTESHPSQTARTASQDVEAHKDNYSEIIQVPSSPEISLKTRINTSPRRRRSAKMVDVGEIKPKLKAGKKVIMLRESLPGVWAELDESEAAKRTTGRIFRYSQVEILDMSSV